MENIQNEKLITFFSGFTKLKYQKGDIILTPDKTPESIYYLLEGYVKMYTLNKDGKELIINIFKPGSYFPIFLAISNLPNRHYYQALQKTDIHRAPKTEVMDFIGKNTEILMDLTRRISLGLNGLITNMELILFGDAYHRVLAALYLCAKRFGEKKGDINIIIHPSLTHQDIANLTGLTRETVSSTMMKIEKEKIIAYHRGILKLLNLKEIENQLELFQSSTSASIII